MSSNYNARYNFYVTLNSNLGSARSYKRAFKRGANWEKISSCHIGHRDTFRKYNVSFQYYALTLMELLKLNLKFAMCINMDRKLA